MGAVALVCGLEVRVHLVAIATHVELAAGGAEHRERDIISGAAATPL